MILPTKPTWQMRLCFQQQPYVWLRNRTLASKLVEVCYQGECSDSNSWGYLWEKERRSEDDTGKGYSLQRWNCYHCRTGELSKHCDADEHSKETCRKYWGRWRQ